MSGTIVGMALHPLISARQNHETEVTWHTFQRWISCLDTIGIPSRIGMFQSVIAKGSKGLAIPGDLSGVAWHNSSHGDNSPKHRSGIWPFLILLPLMGPSASYVC